MNKKNKKWWQYLLMIPVCLLIDLLVFSIAAVIDFSIASGEQGHPAPFITLMAILILGIVTLVVIIYALVKCIQSLVKEKKNLDNEKPEVKMESLNNNGQKKAVWHCFIPLFVEIPLSVIVVFLCGRKEINAFYNDPSHIGFAIPVSTFAIAFMLFLLTVVLLLVCIFAAFIRSKKNKQIAEV